MSLAHSNIAQVLDLGVAQGRYFLVLELVDGWDLGRVHAAGGGRGRAAAARARPAHHRRRLPGARLRARQDRRHDARSGSSTATSARTTSFCPSRARSKLTDFGIAKAMNKREQTGTGVVKGKVAFMSPEQAMGKPIDQRSDLFSLGTVLYLLMVRSRPFEGPTDLETLLRVQKGDFLPPEAAAPDLEPEVAAIINRAMKPDANERYQSADEMLADIEHVARNVFRPVGQTELKRWLAELSRSDGQPSILQGDDAPDRQPHGHGDGRARRAGRRAVRLAGDSRGRDRRRGADVAGGRRGGGRRAHADVARARPQQPALVAAGSARRRERAGWPRQRGAVGDAGSRDRGAAGSAAQAQRRRLLQGAVHRRRCWSAAPGSAASTTGPGSAAARGAPAGGASPVETKPVGGDAEAAAARSRRRRSRPRPPRPNRQRRRGRGAKPPPTRAKEDERRPTSRPANRSRQERRRRASASEPVKEARSPPHDRSQEHDGARSLAAPGRPTPAPKARRRRRPPSRPPRKPRNPALL